MDTDPTPLNDAAARQYALKIASENSSDIDEMIEDAEKLYLFLTGKPQVPEEDDRQATEDSDADRG